MKSPTRLRLLFSLFAVGVAAMFSPARTLAAEPPGLPAGWTDGYAYANGIRIHYYRAKPAPGKPVIVMCHGVTDNGLCWADVALKLQDNYDLYMLDARGHGLTDPFTPNDDNHTIVKDVVGFVQAMKFEKPILMGHSMGGATVIRVGGEYPDLAKAVIVLDAGIGGGGGGRGRGAPGAAPAASGGNAAAPAPAAAAAPARGNAGARADGGPASLPFNMNGTPEALVAQNNYSYDDLVARSRSQHPKWDDMVIKYLALAKKQYHGAYSPEIFRAAMQGGMRSENGLAKVPVPMIILKADASPEQRQAHLEAAKVMQKGKLVHIDGAGHNLHHDNLPLTIKVMTEFLSSL